MGHRQGHRRRPRPAPGARVQHLTALAYRVAAHGLAARERTVAHAAAACGLPDFPAGAAGLALANRVEGPASRSGLATSWSLRGATFWYPPGDAAVFTVGARPGDERSWKAFLPGFAAGYDGSLADAHARVTDEVVDLLAAGPMTKAELSGALRPRLPDGLQAWCRGCQVVHVNEQLLRSTGLSGAVRGDGGGRLVRADPPRADPAEARAELVRRFLRCYGPATPKMLAEWLAVSTPEAKACWPSAGVADVGAGRLLAEDVPAYESPRPAEGVRLLGAGDPFLHQRDREVLAPDPALRKRIWQVLGNPGLVLVAGRPAGLWRPRKKGPALTVLVEPFEPLPDLAAEAAVVAAARGCRDVVVERAG